MAEGSVQQYYCPILAKIARSRSLSRRLADRMLVFAEEYGVAGFHLDWEFPLPEDAPHFENMLGWIHERFAAKRAPGGRPQLSIAVGGAERFTSRYTAKMCDYLDFIVVMSYTGKISDLESENNKLSEEGTKAAFDAYVGMGFPRDKLVLGVQNYFPIVGDSQGRVVTYRDAPISMATSRNSIRDAPCVASEWYSLISIEVSTSGNSTQTVREVVSRTSTTEEATKTFTTVTSNEALDTNGSLDDGETRFAVTTKHAYKMRLNWLSSSHEGWGGVALFKLNHDFAGAHSLFNQLAAMYEQVAPGASSSSSSQPASTGGSLPPAEKNA